MKKLFFVLWIGARAVSGQDITGAWSGELAVQGMKLPLVFNFTAEGNGFKATMDSPKQGAKGMPVQETRFENGKLTLSAPGLGLTYTATLKGEHTLEGEFSQGGIKLPLTLVRGISESGGAKRPQTPEAPYAYYTEEVTFPNEKEGNLLAGTLAAPGEGRNFPVMVMITGSGAQDRNEEIMGHKPFLVIADFLAKRGIATLRLDDRGVGGSAAGKAGATSEDFAGDISSAVNFLAARGYGNIGLIGHSEGGMIAPMVAAANSSVKFMVFLAAPGIPLSNNMELQLSRLYRAAGLSNEVVQEITQGFQRLFKEINTRETAKSNQELHADLMQIFAKVSEDRRGAYVNEIGPVLASAWGRFFLRFNPDDYLSKVKMPVLAVNGSLDMNVPSAENLAGIRKSLEKAGNRNFEVVEFEGLNHLFQTASTGSPSEYGVIEETISPKVLEKIGSWVLQIK